jgi:UDP-N-acetylglucosamine:LPS N-acetylglucosamine transferase
MGSAEGERTVVPQMLFFSRGRGRGHAVPDMMVAEELRRIDPELAPAFVSYGTGADTLAEGGYPVFDLELPDDAPFFEILVRAARLIAREQPDIVVAHEEFAALPAAKALDCPALFIVDFFLPTADHPWMQSLHYADEILFIERRGLFPEPPGAAGRTSYVGPIVRRLSWTRADRARARQELGLAPAATVVSVIPGSWATEERAPLVELVRHAFASLPAADKTLVWVAGRDHERLSALFGSDPHVRVLEGHSPIEALMVASDLVITKANRGTTIELACLGVPSISLSYGANIVDETIVARLPSHLALNAKAVDAPYLAEVMTAALSEPPPPPRPQGGGELAVARGVARFLEVKGRSARGLRR